MIQYQTSPVPPHLSVRLSGTISEEEARTELQGFLDTVRDLPEGYTAIISCVEPTYLTAQALGPLYYCVVKATDTRPGLTVLVYGEQGEDPHLSAFLRRLIPGNRVRIARSEEEARRVIVQHQTDGESDA